MKYAGEVMGVMRLHPGRQFRMAELVRAVKPGVVGAERQRIRNGVLRVLAALEANGSIEVEGPGAERGGYALYAWKVPHAVPLKCHGNCHNSPGPLRL